MPPPRTSTVHTVVLWPFIEAIRRLDPAGTAAPELAALQTMVGTRMPHERARELLQRAVTQTRRPDLGVLAAEAVEPGHFELVELASRAQRSVGEGLRTLASLVPILHDGLVVKLVSTPGISRIRITLQGGSLLEPAGYDFIVASLVIGGRRQTRLPELCPTRVRLPYAQPRGEPALARILACQLEFGADALEIEFPSSDLELPLVRANASMGQVLREAARELIDQDGEQNKLERAVRERLREGLASGAVDAKTIARKLHMSERTLRRRLDAEGLGLRALVDDLRRELALEMLADAARSTEEIAAELGFTTAQAFHRAFRRWTGGTVQGFRARGGR